MHQLFSFPAETDDIGISRFNLDENELQKMYRGPAPDDYDIVVELLYRDDGGKANAQSFLKELEAEACGAPVLKFELTGDAYTFYSSQELPWLLEDIMSPEQQAWWHNGVYVECGIWRPDLADDPSLMRGIGVAMTWYDTSVKPISLHTTIDPAAIALEAHDPDDQTPSIVARNFRLVVGDIFREGVGVWCRDLVDARNEVLVKVRSRLAGKDPQAEWERFQAHGLNYFLDYTLIAP
jgi:hypothetical protein